MQGFTEVTGSVWKSCEPRGKPGNRTIEAQRRDILRMATETRTAHTTWTQPPLKANNLIMPDGDITEIYPSRCLDTLATNSAKITAMSKIYSSASRELNQPYQKNNTVTQFGCCIPEKTVEFKAKQITS